MHEVSLIMGLLRIVEEQAVEHQFEKVREIRLEVGKLSCVEPDALRFCFDTAKHGTIAEEAALVIEEVSGRAWCHVCEEMLPLDSLLDACPRCGTVGMIVESGGDLRIKELEVD